MTRLCSRRRAASFRPSIEMLEDRNPLSTYTVDHLADDLVGQGLNGSLRYCIQRATDEDRITFGVQGTITLTRGELAITRDLDIEGPGADQLAVSGNHLSRIFDIGEGVAITIAGLTLSAGLATDGAGILNAGDLTLANDLLAGNVAQGTADGGLYGDSGGRGGGVENRMGANLAVRRVRFVRNLALGGPDGGNAFGGGIDNEAGTVTINQCTFLGNRAVAGDGGTDGVMVTLLDGSTATLLGVGAGGGIWSDGGPAMVADSVLSDNLSQGGSNGDAGGSTAMLVFVGTAAGGAIGSGAFFTAVTPTLTITASTLSGNQALGGSNVTVPNSAATNDGSGRGGAIAAAAGDVVVSDSTLRGNLAQGGALSQLVRDGSVTAARGSLGAGGGIDDEFNFSFNPPPTMPILTITGSTVRGNQALGNGPGAGSRCGGVCADFADTQLIDSTVSDNQAIGSRGGVTTISGRDFAVSGGNGTSGGIDGYRGSLTIHGSTINNNLARGGMGGPTAASGSGGNGLNGGIDSSQQVFVLVNSTLSGNQAVGGDATAGGLKGGDASPGALYLTFDSADIRSTTFVDNRAQGGAGGRLLGEVTGGAAVALRTYLQMADCLFQGNKAIGGPGSSGGGPGGAAYSGGMHITEGSTVAISNTVFIGNLAQGGAGGAGDTGGAGGTGGSAFVGGLANTLSSTTIRNSTFIQNVAQGGAGGPGGADANGGAGGRGQGGAIWDALAYDVPPEASLTVINSSIVGNQAIGGAGGVAGGGGTGGRGGNADGGGLFSSRLGITGEVTLTINSCFIDANAAVGGAGQDGGTGGASQGGGLAIDADTTAMVRHCFLDHNTARGGDSAGGGTGGNGLGGGLYVADGAGVHVTHSRITHNQAQGSDGGGANGLGLGGGVYNLGTLIVDALTVITHNRASTSDDDCFGC